MKDAVWFMQLHKNSIERFCKLFPTVNQYMSRFDNCSFKLVSKLNLLSTALMKHYYDPEGPLKKEWRNGSSYWGFVTDQELLHIEKSVRKMNEDGTMMQFIKEHDRTSEIGSLTILAGVSL